ncbi:MAG: hypothetical protein HRU11_08785 [Parvularculaceae bacterium]|nr:hypothetical protein [Parvularculaceae bacterium]
MAFVFAALSACALPPPPYSTDGLAQPTLVKPEGETAGLVAEQQAAPAPAPVVEAPPAAKSMAPDAGIVSRVQPPRRGLPLAFFPDDHLMVQADLKSGDARRVSLARTAIENRPQAYPPYLYAALSEALLETGEADDAAFWYYASRVRTKFDANRCNLSPSSAEHERILGSVYGREISRRAFEEPDAVAKTLTDALRFDDETSNEYDPRWIYYLPMSPERGVKVALPVPPSDALCQPEDRWPLIKDATRLAFQREIAATMPSLTAGRTAALRSSTED